MEVHGVSEDGDTAVGGLGAFVWTRNAGIRELPLPPEIPGGSSDARGVSADGSIIVGAASGWIEALSDVRTLPVVWQREGEDYVVATPQEIVDVALGTAIPYNVYLVGVSDDGVTLVGNTSYAGPLTAVAAFRWNPADGFTYFENLIAVATSASGAVVAAHRGNNYGDVVRIGETNDTVAFGLPRGISADGAAVVGWAFEAGQREAFRAMPGADLDLLGTLDGDPGSEAMAATADGSTVVGASGVTPPNLAIQIRAAFVWDAAHGMRALQPILETQLGHPIEGWTLLSPQAISADGTFIAGTGRNPDGNVEGFVAQLPEPSGATTALASLAALAVRLRICAASSTGAPRARSGRRVLG
jgi:uncharacterized membrane protein